MTDADLITANPCRDIRRAKAKPRDRPLTMEEFPLFWERFGDYGVAGVALRVLALMGQRPGEIAALHREHIDQEWWWHLPGTPCGQWPGTKYERPHIIFVPEPVRELISGFTKVNPEEGLVFGPDPDKTHRDMQIAMRKISKQLGVEQARPHDLRHTHGTTICRMLGLVGRPAMNRVQNHAEGGISDVYDHWKYRPEIESTMTRVAAELMRIAERRAADEKVVALVVKP